MSNTYTGTGGASGLEVRTVNLATDLFGIDIIEVSNGTLTVGSSPNIAVITTGGGGGGAGTVTSVGLAAPAAFTVTGTPVTGAGTLTLAGAGTVNQYIDGTGALQTTTTIGFGTTGLTPATATAGVVTVAGTLVVANGGTGATTLTDGGVLLGSGTGAITPLGQATDGQLVIGSTGADPVLATLASVGGTVAITTSAGGINLEAAAGIGGSIADTQVAYGTGANAIEGEPELTYIDTAGSRKFNILDSDAGTTTVLYPLKVSRISTGTAAVGLGVGLEFEAEAPAQAGVNVVGSILESISTAGINAATTRFDLVIKNHNGSGDPALTNEVARFTSVGGFSTSTSIVAGTTFGVDPVGGGTVTVGGSGGVVVDGTGGVSTVNGAISAGGATGAVNANTSMGAGTTVTGGTGVIATTGGVLASAGGVTATLGNIVATAGSMQAQTGVISVTGDISATAGNLSAAGNESKIASISTAGVPIANTELLDAAFMGQIVCLGGDNYTLGTGALDAATLGFTATFLPLAAAVTVAIGGVACDGVVAGGAVSAVGFTCPQNEPFTISFIGNLQNVATAGASGLVKVLQVYGNATAL